MSTLQLESILDLASILARQTNYNEILRLTTEKARSLFKAKSTRIMMINPTTNETLKTVISHHEKADEGKFTMLHTYLSGRIIQTNNGFRSNDLVKDGISRPGLFEDMSSSAVLCEPIRIRGSIFGTLLLYSEGSGKFSEEDQKLLQQFTAVAAPFLKEVRDIQSYFEAPLTEQSLVKKYKAFGLLGKSVSFIALLRSIESAAASDVRVLLEGASGTGKELVAKSIHKASARSNGTFVAIDCGAIPGELIESEMFGHVKGAFTGSGNSRKGLMEEADGGTLFMDEISNLPMSMQSKLLRTLQENEIRPLGSNTTRKINIRIIAATSRSLKNLVEEGKFREDLFYRLYVYPIEIPSLSERKEDISMLALHFLKRSAHNQQKNLQTIAPGVLQVIKSLPWKGNIRELENLMERMVVSATPTQQVLDPDTLPGEFKPEQADPDKSASEPEGLKEAMDNHEKHLIEQALSSCDWNQSAAARILHVSEHTIRYKIKQLGITRQK